MPMMAGASNFVVWEWMEDNGQWIPYGPRVCQDLEKGITTGGTIKISFGILSHTVTYEVDLSNMVQINPFTKNRRQVRRRLLPPTSVLLQKHVWEWNKGKSQSPLWSLYSTELMEEIEVTFKTGLRIFYVPLAYGPYKLDFGNFAQENIITQFTRAIRRRQLSDNYPVDSGTVPFTSGSSHVSYPHSGSHPHAGVNFYFNSTSQPTYSSATYATGAGASSIASSHLTSAVLPNPQTAASGSSKKRNTKKMVQLPTCPPGGIPCSSTASSGTVPVSQVLKTFTKAVEVQDTLTDQCAICQSDLTDHSGFGSSKETLELTQCKHVFHLECLEASYSHGVQNGCIVCSTCNKMHGIKTGDQPSGTMTYTQMHSSLPGYSGCGTLEVRYDIQHGTQTSEHPHPGRRYRASGFPRVAYLPDNNEGKRVLLLLIEAWKRRLIFTVGQSSTTGQDDCVTWTGIHHKTELRDRKGHGYPDNTYLDRVMAELEAVGVLENET